MAKTQLAYGITLENPEALSQRTLDKIQDAIYAGIESELEDVRKNGDIDDYEIKGEVKNPDNHIVEMTPQQHESFQTMLENEQRTAEEMGYGDEFKDTWYTERE